jgi:hypothetical protein
MSLLSAAQKVLQESPEVQSSMMTELLQVKEHGNFNVITTENGESHLRLIVDTSNFLGFAGYLNIANMIILQAHLEIMNVEALSTYFLNNTLTTNIWTGKGGVLVVDYGPPKLFESKKQEAKKAKKVPPPAAAATNNNTSGRMPPEDD